MDVDSCCVFLAGCGGILVEIEEYLGQRRAFLGLVMQFAPTSSTLCNGGRLLEILRGIKLAVG